MAQSPAEDPRQLPRVQFVDSGGRPTTRPSGAPHPLRTSCSRGLHPGDERPPLRGCALHTGTKPGNDRPARNLLLSPTRSGTLLPCGSGRGGVVANLHVLGGEVLDLGRPGEEIVGNDRAVDGLAQLDLTFPPMEVATPDQNGPGDPPGSAAAVALGAPIIEGAIAEAHGSRTLDFGDLIAPPPKSAVDKPHDPSVWTKPRLVGSSPLSATNSPLVIRSPNGAHCSTTTERKQASAPMPRKLPLHTPLELLMNLYPAL